MATGDYDEELDEEDEPESDDEDIQDLDEQDKVLLQEYLQSQ